MPAADAIIPVKDMALVCWYLASKSIIVPYVKKRIAVLGAIGTDTVPKEVKARLPKDHPKRTQSPTTEDKEAKI